MSPELSENLRGEDGLTQPSCHSCKRSNKRKVVHLLLLPELHLHLLVPQLVLADAVAGDEVAADVGQLWVLLPCFFDQTKKQIVVNLEAH